MTSESLMVNTKILVIYLVNNGVYWLLTPLMYIHNIFVYPIFELNNGVPYIYVPY